VLSPRLLSAREAGLYLGLAYDSVLGLVQAGVLQPVKLGTLRKLLFDRLDLDQLVERGKAKPYAS
jgi:excisionase family DNA binding protein